MTDRTPTTEAGRQLSDDIAQLADSAEASVWDDGNDLFQHFDGLIVKAEDEAREGYVTEDNCAASQRKAVEIAERWADEARAPLVAALEDAMDWLEDEARHLRADPRQAMRLQASLIRAALSRENQP